MPSISLKHTAPMSVELQLKGVSRHWGGTPVLRDLSLRVQPGERIALIGPSGAGKSTLIRLMAGALRATAGTIDVDGTPLDRMGWRALQRHRARCRIVEQQNLLVPQATVHRNVLAGLLPHWPWWRTLAAALWPVQAERVAALLQSLDMGAHQWALAGALSGGQMQRVAIARALVSEPDILLADEPTASLDPHTAKAVTRLITEQARLRGMTLVFCTHWFDIARQDCTRVIGLRRGEILFDCAPQDATEARLDQLYAGSNERL